MPIFIATSLGFWLVWFPVWFPDLKKNLKKTDRPLAVPPRGSYVCQFVQTVDKMSNPWTKCPIPEDLWPVT